MPQDILSQENIEKRYQKIPIELKRALISSQTGDIVEKAVILNKAPENITGDLIKLVGFVLLGIYHFEDFKEYLAQDFNLDSLLAQSLGKDIDTQIFLPLRKQLEIAYNLPWPGEEGEEYKESFSVEAGKKSPLEAIGDEQSIFAKESADQKETKEEGGEGGFKPIEISGDATGGGNKAKEEEILEDNRNAINESAFSSGRRTAAEKAKIFPQSLSFKKSGVIADIKKAEFSPEMILGREEKLRPTLETGPAFSSVFEQVRPKEEKIISSLEIEGGEKKEKENKPWLGRGILEKIKGKMSFGLKPASAVLPVSLETKPTKIVNFDSLSSIVKAEPEKEIIVSEKNISFSKLDSNKPIANKPAGNLSDNSNLKEERKESENEKGKNIQDNIIDLKKLKF